MSNSPSISQLLSVLLPVLAVLPSPSAQLTKCGYCMCDRPSITCDFDQAQDRIKGSVNLPEFAPNSGILRGLQLDPLDYRDLYINCKNSPSIKNQRLTRGLLRGYTNLTRVAVVKCDITDIEPDALDDLAALRELDVSNNRLRRLPAQPFRSRTMGVLTLSENSGLMLTADTFRNFSLERLVLSKCGLQEFPWDSLSTMHSLRELTLSQNSIRLVPTDAIELVTKLRVFYLDDNPLMCTCSNQWLSERIDWNRVSPPIIKSAKLPKCGSPPTLLDVELTRLSPGDFPCPAPEIRSVDIRLEPDSAQLICSATVDRPGPLVWTYRHLPVYPEMPNAYPSRTYQSSGATFRQSVRRTPGYEREKYTLTARGEDGQTANFSLTLHWPLIGDGAATEPKDSSPAAKEKTDGGGQQDDDSDSTTGQKLPTEPQKPTSGGGGDYFSRKQFTLIEMIIAVVGTFMGTSLVFLLACQAIQWYNKRDKKRWAAGYAGPPYNYSYNSHRPPSHEYDVPRIDQPCLLPKQPPPPTQPPPPPPQHTLPMPPTAHTLPPGAGVSLSSTSSGSGASAAVQTLLSKHQHPHHHHQQQQQHLPATSSSSSAGIGETEFLDYGGHRMVFNHA